MPRKYDLGKRKTMVEDTRRRIVQAAVHLHSTKGPARTSMQDIAHFADVSLVTVYRHFPTLGELLQACRGAFFQEHPLPGPEIIDNSRGLYERVVKMLKAIYRYYHIAGETLWRVQMDEDVVPELATSKEMRRTHREALAKAALATLSSQSQSYKQAFAVLMLALDLGTWRILAKQQDLQLDKAAELMADLVLSVAGAKRGF